MNLSPVTIRDGPLETLRGVGEVQKKILVVKKFMHAMAINPKINTNCGLNKFIYKGNVI